jgi:acyl-CoA thioesterase-1
MEDPCKIACFGDSITFNYAPLLEERLRARYPARSVEVINGGVVGETSRQGMARLDAIAAERPTVCVLGFGMNDWRKGVERREFRANLCAMVDRLQAGGTRVILLTMNPDAQRHGGGSDSYALQRYNDDIRDLAHERRLRIADAYSLWTRSFPQVRQALHDEIHPNEAGYGCTVDALLRVLTRSYTTLVWQFNGEECFCNYSCAYCYVPSQANTGQHWRGTVEKWHDGFLSAFGRERLVFYLSFGEPMAGRNFYEVLDMIASEPHWSGHMTSNLSLPLGRLLQTRLVREGRFHVNASYHPSQTTVTDFLKKLLELRAAGIEPPVVYVMWPPQAGEPFDEALRVLGAHGFLIHVRRFRGMWEGKRYPQAYTEEERRRVARYADDATIKYMLNDFEDGRWSLHSKPSYAGMYYAMVDNEGDVWVCPDYHGEEPLGNVLKGTLRLPWEPQPFAGTRDGTVDGIMSLLELDYEEPRGNHVMAFAEQGGVRKSGSAVAYGNLHTRFDDPAVQMRLRWPDGACSAGQHAIPEAAAVSGRDLIQRIRQSVAGRLRRAGLLRP